MTGTFVDYALPSAAERAELRDRPHRDAVADRTRSASRASARRARSPRSPAVTNAVIDALRPLGVTYINMPLTPMRVWEAIQEAGGAPA